MIKSLVLLLAVGCLAAFLVPAPGTYAQDYQALLKKADSLVNFPDTDFSAQYTIEKYIPGEGKDRTVCVIYRRDAAETYTIVILAPEHNKGQGYLKLNETLWFYDPESRRFNSSSAKDRFQNSNARNSDFTRSTLAQDYDVVKGERVKLGKYDCTLLHLKANNDEVTFPIMRIWITDDGLVRKTEDCSLSGQLERSTAIGGYMIVGKKYVPKVIYIVDELRGGTVDGKYQKETTVITVSHPSLDRVPDSYFSKFFLENVSR